MTQSVWKYPLVVNYSQVIDMPAGATPLKVDVQNGQPCLWVLVNPAVETEPRKVLIRGTGHQINYFVTASEYVDSFMLCGSALVFHVFVKGA